MPGVAQTRDMAERIAVRVEDAYKRYTDAWVLKGLNMHVDQGSIYALLGPSGCGKSTLLSCIVGQMELDSGKIQLSCQRRNQLGYMPQTIALYLTMTIGETFTYYGRMGNMNKRQIAQRTERLANLLELPPLNRVVDTLSGGQQRRVSLSVALVNDPMLLLLDEPTVGLDPVLSNSIWTHLLKLVREEKKTIVITTHYIEEARQASTVGLMRGGVLLCEETPDNLLKNNNCDTMEQVFLKLSRKQEEIPSNNNNNVVSSKEETIPYNRKSQRARFKRGALFSIPYFYAEVTKNVIFIWRNKPILLLLMLLPFLLAYLSHYALGPDPKGVQLAIVNQEVDGLEECFNQKTAGCNSSIPISCRVLKELWQSNIELIEFKTLEEAQDAVNYQPNIWGAILVKKNYTESLVERFSLNLQTPPDILDKGQILVWIDKSNYLIGKYIEIFINEAFFGGIGSFFKDCGWPLQTFNVPINFQKPLYGALRPNMRHYVSTPLIILIVFYLPMSYTISVLLQEKLNGVLERSMVAGLKLSEVLMGHVTVQLVVLAAQCFVIIVTVYWYHQHPMNGSLFWTTCLLMLQGISGLAFGFLMSVNFATVTSGMYVSIGTLLTYFFLSGSLWPQEGLHYSLKLLRPIIPISYSVEALRGLTARGWPITHPIVLKGFVSVGTWSFLFIVTALFIENIRRYVSKR